MSGIGIEDDVAAKWIRDLLHADSALMAAAPGGIFDGPAQGNAPYPLCEILMQSSVGVIGVGGVEVMQNQLWIVRGVTEGTSYVPLAVIAQRSHALLHGARTVVVSNGTIESCTRVQQLRQQSVQGGRQLRYLGGVYRIYVQGS